MTPAASSQLRAEVAAKEGHRVASGAEDPLAVRFRRQAGSRGSCYLYVSFSGFVEYPADPAPYNNTCINMSHACTRKQDTHRQRHDDGAFLWDAAEGRHHTRAQVLEPLDDGELL